MSAPFAILISAFGICPVPPTGTPYFARVLRSPTSRSAETTMATKR